MGPNEIYADSIRTRNNDDEEHQFLFVNSSLSNNSFLLPSLKMPKKSEDLKIVKQAMTFEPALKVYNKSEGLEISEDLTESDNSNKKSVKCSHSSKDSLDKVLISGGRHPLAPKQHISSESTHRDIDDVRRSSSSIHMINRILQP